ncbi:MAG: xanthine phosphoribosyltransferase [Candidatus Melainabacteria bacterium]|nr:MAG: xanthine phosphoribosyltransferase [Candidatus Melainabacteria bacterium]
MLALKKKLESEAKCLPNGIIGMSSFLNHQVDAPLLKEVGEEFARRFQAKLPTKILTAETSGLLPALSMAMVLGLPMIYARKQRPVTMVQEPYTAEAESHTKGGRIRLYVTPEFLLSTDRVVIIDDVLASAVTTLALVSIVKQSGAALVGIGAVIEKCYENGRQKLEPLNVPIESLAKVISVDNARLVLAD